MKRIRYHVHASVRGLLMNPDPITFIDDDEGNTLTDAQARDWLMDCLVQGKEKLPLGKPCEGFSYTTGCPGHVMEPEEIQPDTAPTVSG